MGEDARDVVERFWATMGTNDFRAVGDLLDDDYVLEWPQTGERIRGREAFAGMNEAFPAAGRWGFTVHRVVADGSVAVSDVSVTDGRRTDRAVTFSEVRDGKILRQTEFWPDPYEPPAWRARWAERA